MLYWPHRGAVRSMLAVVASPRKLNEPPEDPAAFNRKYDKLFRTLGPVVWLASPVFWLALILWWLI